MRVDGCAAQVHPHRPGIELDRPIQVRNRAVAVSLLHAERGAIDVSGIELRVELRCLGEIRQRVRGRPLPEVHQPAIQIGLRLDPALLGPGEDRCVVGNGVIQITGLLVVKCAVFQRGGAFELFQPRIANDIRAGDDRGIGPAGSALDPIIGVPLRMRPAPRPAKDPRWIPSTWSPY